MKPAYLFSFTFSLLFCATSAYTMDLDEIVENVYDPSIKYNYGDVGAHSLANGKLSNLIKLNLENNNIGDAGAQSLASGNLKGFFLELGLGRNNISDVGKKALRASYSKKNFDIDN